MYYSFNDRYRALPFNADIFAEQNNLELITNYDGSTLFQSSRPLLSVFIGDCELSVGEVLEEASRTSNEPSQSSPSGRTRLVSNQAGPSTLEIDSMEARTVFTVILPQIQRERPTLQEMRLKGQVRKADANNYEFVFKASDIVREGGTRKIVKCVVRATRHGLGLRDFGVSGLTCELSKRNLRGWGKSERYNPVRNRNIVEELQPYVLEQVRNRIFPPFPYQHNANHRRAGAARAGSARAGPSQAGPSGAWPSLPRPIQPGYKDDLPQPSEDFSLEDPPPLYSINGKQRPPPPYEGPQQHALNPNGDILPPPPAYNQIFPNGPQRRQSLSPSGRTQLLSNQAGPSTLEIDSMEARTVFTVILPQIQRERPTLQEMRLKGQVRKTDANNYEFVFKASDIVRQGGRRKIVKCVVRATRHGIGLRDFGVSGLTCELPRRSLRGRGRSERYYPVRNRNFEKEFQSNDLEQVRNRIFPPFPNLFNVPENLNWRRPGAPRTEPPPPPQGLPAHLARAPPMEDGPSGARPPQVGPPQAWPPKTRPIQPGYRDDLPQPSEDFSLEDPPNVYCSTLHNPTSIHMKISLMVVILLFMVHKYTCAPIEQPPTQTTTTMNWSYQFWYCLVIVPMLVLLCGEPNNSESSSSESESVSKKKKKTKKKVKKTVRKYLYFPKSDEQEHESTKATKNFTKSTISPQETTRMINDSMITSSTSSTFDRTLKSFIPSTSPVKISLSSTVSKLSKPSKVSSAKSTIKTIIKTPPSKLTQKENVKHRATDKKAKPVQSRFKEKPPK